MPDIMPVPSTLIKPRPTGELDPATRAADAVLALVAASDPGYAVTAQRRAVATELVRALAKALHR